MLPADPTCLQKGGVPCIFHCNPRGVAEIHMQPQRFNRLTNGSRRQAPQPHSSPRKPFDVRIEGLFDRSRRNASFLSSITTWDNCFDSYG